MPVLAALGILTMALSMPLATNAIRPAWAVLDNTPSVHVVTGTLALMDLTTGKGMIKTDLGKPIFFHISRPDQFSRLSIGDRVTIQLDDEGRSLKVIEALPSEVHEPPPDPK
jgi:cold shock CspA family protein